LRTVVQTLDRLGIDYFVTGSVATSVQGEPRATHDIDLVVSLQENQIAPLVKAFPPPEFYLAESAIREAIRRRSMFNLLAVAEGDKVDFWVLTDSPFDQSRFARKTVQCLFGMSIKLSAPEDTILAKLKWCKDSGGSEKHFSDALRVFEVQFGTLDLGYLESWASRLGIAAEWWRLLKEAEPI